MFGGAKDFCPNLPKLARKSPKNVTSKKTSELSFWVSFLENRSTYSDFANVFTHFAQMSTDFKLICPDFHQIKRFVVAVAPAELPPPTTARGTISKNINLTKLCTAMKFLQKQ